MVQHRELVLYKAPLNIQTVSVRDLDSIEEPILDKIVLFCDERIALSVFKEIHRQRKIITDHTRLVPKFVTLDAESYGQLLAFQYNFNGEILNEEILGLTVIVGRDPLTWVEVRCSPRDELLYRDELSELRSKHKK